MLFRKIDYSFLVGEWYGEYDYEGPFTDLPSVNFTMNLKVDADDLIMGSIVDEMDDEAVAYPAKVSGFIERKTIEFSKLYPKTMLSHLGGGFEFINRSCKVFYKGRLNDDGTVIMGSWELPSFDYESGGLLRKVAKRTGTWFAHKDWK